MGLVGVRGGVQIISGSRPPASFSWTLVRFVVYIAKCRGCAVPRPHRYRSNTETVFFQQLWRSGWKAT